MKTILEWGSLEGRQDILITGFLVLEAVSGDFKIKLRMKLRLERTFMKTVNFITSACRYCRFYQPEGRRGGNCQQLGVSVRGGWKACSLALPPFAPSWENLEGIMIWNTDDTLSLADTVEPSLSCAELTPQSVNITHTYQKSLANAVY